MSTEADAWQAFSARLFDQNAFAIKLGLDNIRRAFALEGHPERCAPAIVVGGTNGKGSVASALAAILTGHGLRVGLFTSPHLIEFRERFRIDGRPLGRAEVLRVGRHVMERYGEAGADPTLTFFELSTLMAALAFRDAAVDVVVWEVGLGGRLDAVNAIEPALTVITNIGLDHQQYLGNTIEEIAGEKAGLQRMDVPLVLAPQTHPQSRAAFRGGLVHEVTVEEHTSRAENVATACLAANLYLETSPDLVEAALDRWRWPGRLDIRRARGCEWLVDAAHNPAGVERLLVHLRSNPVDACVVGAMADKDLGAMFASLGNHGPIYIAEIASKRAASAAELRQSMPGARIEFSGVAPEVFQRASKERSRVAVFGSVYLLGEWFDWAHVGVDELVTFE